MPRPWTLYKSQSFLQRQQSQPWSVHNTSPSGKWPSPFPRRFHALSPTVTAAGELFLFGGNTYDHSRNDLYQISTRYFSTTLLQTSGDVPSPRYGHTAVLVNTTLLIWGGRTDPNDNDNSLYLLNLSMSGLFMSRPAPADQSSLRSSIARVDPHRSRWSQARRSLLPYHDVGRFQALYFRWADRRVGTW